MEHVLVSACLCGKDCKWDGGNNRNQALLDYMKKMEGTMVFHEVCPEQMGGLSTPRPASEICAGTGKVVNTEGRDVTAEFERGAEIALEIAKKFGCTMAILKERSPSCGCRGVYDGTFSKTLVDGMGKAAKLLTEHGIRVIGETELDQLMIEEKTGISEAQEKQRRAACEAIIRTHAEKVPAITGYRAVHVSERFYLTPLTDQLSRKDLDLVMETFFHGDKIREEQILAIFTTGPLADKTHCRRGVVFTDTELSYCNHTRSQYKECRISYEDIQKAVYKYRWFSDRQTILLQMKNGTEVELDTDKAKYMVDMLNELLENITKK